MGERGWSVGEEVSGEGRWVGERENKANRVECGEVWWVC